MSAIQIVMKIQSMINSIKNVGSSATNGDEVKGEETDGLVTGVRPTFIDLIAVGGVVACVLTYLWTQGLVVDIATTCCVLLAPYAAYQKHQLNELGGMRGQQNQLRRSVNVLSSENDKLTQNIDGLEKSVGALKHVEEDLSAIATKAGAQVDRLVKIVEENGELQKKMLKKIEADVIQSLMSAILASDRDEDFILDQREIRRLENRLAAIPGVNFSRPNFRKKVGGGDLTLENAMQLVRNLEDKTIPDEQRVFRMEPKQYLKM